MVLAFLQATVLSLAAIYNAILAYESRDKIWKALASGATALFFASLAYFKLLGWPLWH
jgi:hypothetical protein